MLIREATVHPERAQLSLPNSGDGEGTGCDKGKRVFCTCLKSMHDFHANPFQTQPRHQVCGNLVLITTPSGEKFSVYMIWGFNLNLT